MALSKKVSFLDFAACMQTNTQPCLAKGLESHHITGNDAKDWRKALGDGKSFWSDDFLGNNPGSCATPQPYIMLFELPVPEPMYYSVVDGLCGTTGLWFNLVKIREAISISPTSTAHGSILMKQSYQRKDAKEMMATIQTLKTVLLNLESDLEKLREQKLAFDNNNVEKIKGLFVDNYGGPSRNWTAIARAVPLVKTALTWFFKLQKEKKDEMLEEIDQAVKDEQLNPAVANYLKRKVQEYDDWKQSYLAFLKRTYQNIVENLRQQRANIKLYMRWAQRNIMEAENMLVPYDELKATTLGVLDEEFPQFGGKLYTISEMFFESWSQWGIVKRLTEPWFPCFSTQMVFAYNPDLQGSKYCRGTFMIFYGSIHKRDSDKLIKKLDLQLSDFATMMETYGGYDDEQMERMGVGKTEEEKALLKYRELKEEYDKAKKSGKPFDPKKFSELNDVAAKIAEEKIDTNESPSQAEKSFIKEMEGVFDVGGGKAEGDWWESPERLLLSSFLKQLDPIFKLFGSDVVKQLDTRQNRSNWMAQNLFYKFLINLKKTHGIPTWEGWG